MAARTPNITFPARSTSMTIPAGMPLRSAASQARSPSLTMAGQEPRHERTTKMARAPSVVVPPRQARSYSMTVPPRCNTISLTTAQPWAFQPLARAGAGTTTMQAIPAANTTTTGAPKTTPRAVTTSTTSAVTTTTSTPLTVTVPTGAAKPVVAVTAIEAFPVAAQDLSAHSAPTAATVTVAPPGVAPRSFGALSNTRASVGKPVSFVFTAPQAKKAQGRARGQTSPRGKATISYAPSFTTVTNQLPERGLVSAQSLATIQYADVQAPSRDAGDGKPRTRGVGELGGKMEISINILNGASFSVLMAPTETGKDLKRKIETNSEIPPEQQQLVFAGKQIKDDLTMYDYGITKNCVIFCVPKNGDSGVSADACARAKTRKPSAQRRQKRVCPCTACPC